jgi:hypothetical protein
MKENTESEKLEDSVTPEKEENSSDVEETSEIPESSEDESPFEEHEGEVLPAENKNNSGCGFLIIVLLLLTGGGYLYYTDQIPPQIMQWIEPLIGSQPKQNDQIARPPVVASLPEKSPVTLEEKPVFEESLSFEEEPLIKIVSSPSVEMEHISGSPTELTSEPADARYSAKISGNTTLVEPDIKVFVEEPEGQEGFVERAPVFSPPAPKPAEPDQPEKGERDEAVQAYLDFFESALVKIGELIKTGFAKGKDFLKQSFG